MTEAMAGYSDETQDEAPERLIDTPEKRRRIVEIADRIEALQAERKSINEAITSALSEAEAEGVTREAMKAGIKRRALAEDQRIAHDTSYELVLRALECGYQPSLFEPTETPQPRGGFAVVK